MPAHEISEAQWRIMEIIWSRGETTAADVIEALVPKTGWNQQTVRTLLGRLVQKGILNTRPVRNFYVYSALVSREDAVRQEGESFLHRLFNGDPDELLVHFVREGKVDQSTLDRLQQMIDEEQSMEKSTKIRKILQKNEAVKMRGYHDI